MDLWLVTQISVSLETVAIVEGLPELGIEDEMETRRPTIPA